MQDKKGPVAVIVAHPDDEVLWAGGMILETTPGDCFVLCLTRGSDTNRAPKFHKTLAELGVSGLIADVDDGPLQRALSPDLLGAVIQELLPSACYEYIYTHSPLGEYTRHIRHEETGREVLRLWLDGKVNAKEIRLFAYDDANKSILPRAIRDAPILNPLTELIWNKKYRIITDTYGFTKDSFEAKTTPRTEAFWQVRNHREALIWLKKERTE